MDEKRKGEIAIILFKERLRNGGIGELTEGFVIKEAEDMARIPHDVGNIVIPEAKEFIEEIIREMIEKMFPKPGRPVGML